MFLWLNSHLERLTPSTKFNPHLCSKKCPDPPYTEGLEKPSTRLPPQGSFSLERVLEKVNSDCSQALFVRANRKIPIEENSVKVVINHSVDKPKS